MQNVRRLRKSKTLTSYYRRKHQLIFGAFFRIKTTELRDSETRLKELQSQPTTEDAEKEIQSLENTVSGLEERLYKVSSEQNLVSKVEREKIKKKHELAVKEWRKRKRMCTNIIDAILENYPKSKKDFFEDVGIETDEEVGVKIPDMY